MYNYKIKGEIVMSLQINAGSNNYMIQNIAYSGYGASGTASAIPAGNGGSNGQSATVEGMQNDRLMKKIGAIECKT